MSVARSNFAVAWQAAEVQTFIGPMSETLTRILIGVMAVTFVAVSVVLLKPVSGGGRLARKLCIANAVGWFFILPLSTTGHPPAFLFPTILFWLINLVLLPAAAFALWTSYKDREENVPFLGVASSYVVLNIVLLFVVPLLMLVR